jgi:hypothetical protein
MKEAVEERNVFKRERSRERQISTTTVTSKTNMPTHFAPHPYQLTQNSRLSRTYPSSEVSSLFEQMAIYLFAARECKNRKKPHTLPPKRQCNVCSICVIYICGRGLRNTSWRVAGWTCLSCIVCRFVSGYIQLYQGGTDAVRTLLDTSVLGLV